MCESVFKPAHLAAAQKEFLGTRGAGRNPTPFRRSSLKVPDINKVLSFLKRSFFLLFCRVRFSPLPRLRGLSYHLMVFVFDSRESVRERPVCCFTLFSLALVLFWESLLHPVTQNQWPGFRQFTCRSVERQIRWSRASESWQSLRQQPNTGLHRVPVPVARLKQFHPGSIKN